MQPLNLGIIGAGKWVREAYIPILKHMPRVRVVAVAAKTRASRDWVRGELGPSVTLHSEFEDLIAQPGVDAVAIALPNRLHADAIRTAAAAGKHVLFEPPLGLNAADMSRALRALRESGRVAQADLELRCLPVVDLIRDQLAAGTIGEPLMCRVRLWCDWGWGGGEWVSEVEEQGFFPWLGCWYLDLLDRVYEAPAIRACVTGGYAMNGRIMDHGLAALEFPGQRVGVFEFSLVAMEGTQIELRVAGTRGELEADLLTGLCRWRGRRQAWQEERRPCAEPVHGFAGMRESLEDFVSAVLDGRRPRADLEVCRRVHQAVWACAQSELRRSAIPVSGVQW